MVLANFLLSPEAQARKLDIDVWGDPSVLDMRRLEAAEREAFEGDRHPASPPPDALQRVLPEPHPSWVEALEAQWQVRYGDS